MQAGKGIHLAVLIPWMVSDGELESREEKRPASLVEIEPFVITEVLEIFVNGNYQEWKVGSLQPVAPDSRCHNSAPLRTTSWSSMRKARGKEAHRSAERARPPLRW